MKTDLCVPEAGGDDEGCLTGLVGLIHGRPVVQKQLDRALVTIVAGGVEGCETVLGGLIHGRPVAQQQLGRALVQAA